MRRITTSETRWQRSMNSTRKPSDQQTPKQRGNPNNRLDALDAPPRPTPATDDWEYHKRGPRLLASIGNTSWVRRAERERLAKQRKGQDTTYVHRWWLKDQHSAKTPTISRDAEALAITWGRPIGRSADEPDADPVSRPPKYASTPRRTAATTSASHPTGAIASKQPSGAATPT